jgi:hypothetical protein
VSETKNAYRIFGGKVFERSTWNTEKGIGENVVLNLRETDP